MRTLLRDRWPLLPIRQWWWRWTYDYDNTEVNVSPEVNAYARRQLQ